MRHQSHAASRRLTVSVAVALATTLGAAPAVAADAAPGVSPATAAATGQQQAAVPFPQDADLVSAGRTGFLTWGRDGHPLPARWTRYADGSTTDVTAPFTFGSRDSDVVVRQSGPFVTLRDMATDTKVLSVNLEGIGERARFAGAVRSTLFVSATDPATGGMALRLVDQPDAASLVQRTVTGLPANTTSVFVAGAAGGHALLSVQTASPSASHWVLVDLATATVTETRETIRVSGTPTLSSTHIAWVEQTDVQMKTLLVLDRATRAVQRIPLGATGNLTIGLVGNSVVYAQPDGLLEHNPSPMYALTARDLTTKTTRKLLDTVKSLLPGPDGTLTVQGGTLAGGEGLYRISAGADGAPAVTQVATSGESTKVTLLGHSIPATIDLSRNGGRARMEWRLSRINVTMTVTLRNTRTGETRTDDVHPLSVSYEDPHRASYDWAGDVAWNGEPDLWSGATAGPYTWQIEARPLNGIGPNLRASGTFTVTRPPAPHDYDSDGSPDVLTRDTSGRLWRGDAFYRSELGQLDQNPGELVGSGWQIYDRVEATGNLGGQAAADLVARDRDGVLWSYLGKGDGTFAARTRIGAGWNTYTRLAGGSDLTGDGRPDLVATDKAGDLYLYPATGNHQAPFSARKRIGHGWGIYNDLTATGNIAGGPAGDLVARDRAGVLWLYLGRGDGTFAARTKIGSGWNAYTHLVGAGDADRDGRPDLYAVNTAEPHGPVLYKGTGDWRAPFRSREQIGAYSDGSDRRYDHFA
ncbi:MULTISPECIES: FG-GAP repeat domain-containing protein [unclassified Streptomyces]|uniref:FG-GAP repeat domain-containing protein n=1 Tax=Streptomyces sp. NPDC127129 TaxID=3345373 RepID=UPI00363B6860